MAAAIASAATSTTTTTTTTITTISGFGRKLMKGVQTRTRLPPPKHRSNQLKTSWGSQQTLKTADGLKRLQIGSGSGDLFDEDGYLADLERKLIKRINLALYCQKKA